MSGKMANSFAMLEVEDTGPPSDDASPSPPLSPQRKPPQATSSSAKKSKAKKRQQERAAAKVSDHSGAPGAPIDSPMKRAPTFSEVARQEPAISAPLASLDDDDDDHNERDGRHSIPNGQGAPQTVEPPNTASGSWTAHSNNLSRRPMKPNGLTPLAPPQSVDMATSASRTSSVFTETEDETPFNESAFTSDADETDLDQTPGEGKPSITPSTPRPANKMPVDDYYKRRDSNATVRSDSQPKSPLRLSKRLSVAQAPPNLGTDHSPTSKKQAVITRTVTTLLMVTGFFVILFLGHIPMICLIFACQTAVFRELAALFDAGTKPAHDEKHVISQARQQRREKRDRWGRVTSWYFYAVTNYFLYGETIIYYFKHIVLIDAYFLPFVRHHRLISVMLWIVGFVGFVSSLNRNSLRRQFGLFCWIHMSLFLILGSSHFIVNNVLEGLIWFWIPSSLVIMNDVAAYCCGMLFGRHQLIKLSPKKTVEGFVGALLVTMLFAYIWASIFMRSPFMICPARELGVTAAADIHCEVNAVFEWHELPLPHVLSTWLTAATRRSIDTLPWSPFQLHALVLGVFASLVAPFGGFFASGFKRAYNIKDFGDSIPGHGGLTDRMDCQFLMGMFTYFYYASFCRPDIATVLGIFERATTALDKEQLVDLVARLQQYLISVG